MSVSAADQERLDALTFVNPRPPFVPKSKSRRTSKKTSNGEGSNCHGVRVYVYM